MSKNLEELRKEPEKSTYGGFAEGGKTERREKKKRKRMRISGRGVFELKKIIKKKVKISKKKK